MTRILDDLYLMLLNALFIDIDTIRLSFSEIQYSISAALIFGKDSENIKKLHNEVEKSILSGKYEKKFLIQILKDYKKVYENDMFYTLATMADMQDERVKYMQDVFEQFSTSLGMEMESKFYLPRKKANYIDELEFIRLVQILHGFNYENMIEFFTDKDVYSEKEISELLALSDDVRKKKGIIVPKIVDDRTILKNVESYTQHKVLQLSSELSEPLLKTDDLAIFYKMLYKRHNEFVKDEIITTPLSEKLYANYQEEPFNEQVKKYIYYRKNK